MATPSCYSLVAATFCLNGLILLLRGDMVVQAGTM